MALTQKEIADWAIANGFRLNASRELVAEYGGGQVIISFPNRNVHVRAEKDGQVQYLVKTNPNGPAIEIDAHGMIRGLGLTTPFATQLLNNADTEIPVWFPQAYLDALRAPRTPVGP